MTLGKTAEFLTAVKRVRVPPVGNVAFWWFRAVTLGKSEFLTTVNLVRVPPVGNVAFWWFRAVTLGKSVLPPE